MRVLSDLYSPFGEGRKSEKDLSRIKVRKKQISQHKSEYEELKEYAYSQMSERGRKRYQLLLLSNAKEKESTPCEQEQ